MLLASRERRLLLIEDFLAGERGEKLRRLSPFAAGCVVSRLDLDDLALRCEADGEEAVAQLYLCPGELDHWRGFRLPRRRLEWLAGRIAAKDAAMRCRGVAGSNRDWQLWQLVVLPSGRPEFLAAGALLPEISISHSGGRAVAMASADRCGIDIQQRREAVVRVKSRFCTEVEEERLAASLSGVDAVSRLTLLWAAKEAIRKAVPLEPLPAFAEMELLTVRGEAPGWMVFDCSCLRRGRRWSPAVGVVLDRDSAVALVAIPSGNQQGET